MRIGIVGGGAAGMMAAATALEVHPDAEVFLWEKNDGLGKKVIISGGGRCNVTTGLRDLRRVLACYPRGNKFLTSAFHQFPPEAVYEWFEAHGVPLHIEEDLRVFPNSDDGQDVVRAFEKIFARHRVEVQLHAQVAKVEKTAEGFAVSLKGREVQTVVNALILTTGGQAYRHTGSTGDGYAFAMALGHTLTPLAASLNSFFTSEKWPAQVSGLSFEKATITARGNKAWSYTGPFLFTHKGVSGPAVFAVSSLVAFESYDATHPLVITIDLFPDCTDASMYEALEAFAKEHTKKSLVNAVATFIPKSLADACCADLNVPPDAQVSQVGKKALTRVAAWLKGIPLHAIARGAGDEFVTAGGIPLSEVNPSTMESKKSPGLFFAGEILDVDGFTGGFNLQASWATGRLAGMSITAS